MPRGKRKYLPYALTPREKRSKRIRTKLKKCIKAVEKKSCTKKALKKDGTYNYAKCKVNPIAVCRASIEGKYNPHKLDFPSEKGYDTKISVYVPDTIGVSQRISPVQHKRRAKETERKLRDIFGGSTSIKGYGTWKSDVCPGGVCEDNMLIVEAGTTYDKWKENDKEMKKYLEKKRDSWGQECLTAEWVVFSQANPKEGIHFLCRT